MRESQRFVRGRVFCAVSFGLVLSVASSLVLVGCATEISGTPTRAVTGFPSSSASASTAPVPTDSPDPTPDPAGSTDSSSSDDGNSPEVVPLLLTVSDLPAGWKVDDSGDDDSSDNGNGPDCLVGALAVGDTSVEGEADFVHEASPLGFLTETIGLDTAVADAQTDYSTAVSGMAGCKSFTYKADDGTTVRGAITALKLTARGDESSGFRVTLLGGALGLSFDLQIVRKGTALLSLLVGGTSAPVLATVEQLAAKAVAKLP